MIQEVKCFLELRYSRKVFARCGLYNTVTNGVITGDNNVTAVDVTDDDDNDDYIVNDDDDTDGDNDDDVEKM